MRVGAAPVRVVVARLEGREPHALQVDPARLRRLELLHHGAHHLEPALGDADAAAVVLAPRREPLLLWPERARDARVVLELLEPLERDHQHARVVLV